MIRVTVSAKSTEARKCNKPPIWEKAAKAAREGKLKSWPRSTVVRPESTYEMDLPHGNR